MWIMFFHNLSKKLSRVWKLGSFVKQLNIIVNGIDISIGAEIGKNFTVVHSVGTVIGKCKIGDNVRIYQCVTLGTKKMNQEMKDAPVIEDNVTIYAGSIVLGSVRIGKNSIIGAGTFVNKDVLQNSIAYNEKKLVIKKITNGKHIDRL